MTAYPLTIYFDASCRLCNSEMQNIKAHDIDSRLLLIDCSSPQFDDTEFRTKGITRSAMMQRLHVRDAENHWHVGVAAFELVYRSVGLNALALLWGHAFTRPVMERCYPWIAGHRRLLSCLGLPELFGCWAKRAARKAEQRSRLCQEGRCNIDE